MNGFTKLFIGLFVLNLNWHLVRQTPISQRFDRRPVKLVEGDIAQAQRPDGKNANIEADWASKWKNGIIPYVIDPDYDSVYRQMIIDSMNVIQTQTKNCIKFVELDDTNSCAKAWLRFIVDNGCWSYIGQGYGEQWVSLVPGCMHIDIIVHELMHAVGFWHEQSRPDRDAYIQVNWSNVLPGYEAEFNSRPDAIDTLNTPYDYYSIMHYRYNTFAIDPWQPTLDPTDPRIDKYAMGTRKDLSEMDVLKVWKYYHCYGY